jgi:predicted esterase
VFSEIVTVSNFGGEAPARVGAYAGVGPFGTYDMAGNVKEWCWNGSGGRRYLLGGAWNEPSYLYPVAAPEPPFAREPTYGVRCAKYEAPLPEPLTHDVEIRPRDYSKEKPVTDEVFSLFRGLYTYDRTELKASAEPGEQAEHWREERVSFTAAYGGERVPARLYLPLNASPPFQTVVFFPGSDAEWLRKGQELNLRWFEFLLRSGRAVLFPVYKGTYERAVPGPWSPHKRRDLVIQWSKDLGRSLDYLETRQDIDRERLAYFGFSLGGTYGPVLTAIEGRLRTTVLLVGGLASSELPPEIDPLNFAPRVRIPVLMLNGRQDFDVRPEMHQWLFRTLGTPEKDKRQVLFEGGHLPPTYHPIIKEVLGWLDERLGPVRMR